MPLCEVNTRTPKSVANTIARLNVQPIDKVLQYENMKMGVLRSIERTPFECDGLARKPVPPFSTAEDGPEEAEAL